MTLVIDEDSRQVRQFVCPCCNTEADRTWANIYEDNAAVAVYYASCYHHNGVHEAWIDAILGTWGDNQFDDHITFGCRVGPVAESPTPGRRHHPRTRRPRTPPPLRDRPERAE